MEHAQLWRRGPGRGGRVSLNLFILIPVQGAADDRWPLPFSHSDFLLLSPRSVRLSQSIRLPEEDICIRSQGCSEAGVGAAKRCAEARTLRWRRRTDHSAIRVDDQSVSVG